MSSDARRLTFFLAQNEADAQPPPQTSRKRKAKALEVGETDFLERNKDCPWKVGAHVSSAGGVENAVLNAAAIGCVILLVLESGYKL